MIPSEIMHHSIKQSKKINIDMTLKFLTNQMLVMDVPGSEEAVDDVIKYIDLNNIIIFCIAIIILFL